MYSNKYARSSTPIRFVDPSGKTIKIHYYDDNGEQQEWSFDGNNRNEAPDNQFVQDFLSAYFYDVENGGGESLVKAATNSKLMIGLRQGTNNKDNTSFFDADRTNDVVWYSNTAVKTDDDYTMSPATVLDHEFGHAVDYFADPTGFMLRQGTGNKGYWQLLKSAKDNESYWKIADKYGPKNSAYGNANEEQAITGTEARTAQANYEYPSGYVRPSHYTGGHVQVSSPISIVPGPYNNTLNIIQMRKNGIWWR